MMIPIFSENNEDGINCALVERVDKPGLLGVAVRGGTYVCALPEGYDGLTSVCMHKGYVIVAHPELPPLLCDPTKGTIELIEQHHVEAKDGKMRLITH
jgi:hypothetical protein